MKVYFLHVKPAFSQEYTIAGIISEETKNKIIEIDNQLTISGPFTIDSILEVYLKRIKNEKVVDILKEVKPL